MNISSMTYAAFNAGRRSGLPLIAALVTMSAQAQTTITFDEVTGATAINNTYAGMVFSNPLTGGSIFVSSAPHFKTPPNVVTVFQTSGAFNEYWGSVQVTFSTLQQSVSIDVAAARSSSDGWNESARPYIRAYDSNGAQVASGEFVGTLPQSGETTAWQTMTATAATATIKSVRFSVPYPASGPWIYGYFDNLRLSPGIFVRCPAWRCR